VNWMDPHAPPPKPSPGWRALGWAALCPVLGGLLFSFSAGNRATSGWFGSGFDASVSAIAGVELGLVVAPFVGLLVWNRLKQRARRRER